MKKKIAVIGSGFAGLSAAACLAREGFDVTVIEKNESPGGRARKFESQGYRFDMGPSWYWMPDVFEKFFSRFGHTPSDFYELIRLDPSYRVFFSAQERMDIPSGIESLYTLFEKAENGSGRALLEFIQEGKYKYETGIQELVYKPGISLSELLDSKWVKGILKLHLLRSVATHVRKHFNNPRLIQLLEFPSFFLGAPASKTPALYSLMNYADMALGTWYPMGGMHKIVEAMVDVALEQGVKFEFNAPVEGFDLERSAIKSIRVNGEWRPVDFVVAGADYHHVEQTLLQEPFRKYSRAYWQTRVMAPSCLIFYLGINKRLENLLHHNLFFDTDFGLHVNEIYETPRWPSNPSFYVCCSSKTDPGAAPEGHENVFILIPVAAGLKDSELIRETYFNRIIQRLENLTAQAIRDSIVYKRSYALQDFIDDYNAFQGNAYGLANTLWQTANLKPSIHNKKVKNLFYTGHLTVPGPGVPPAIISGQVVADELIKRVKSNRLQDL